MNLFQFNQSLKPRKPYIMKRGKANKYNRVALDENRVLKNGSIVARTLSVHGLGVGEDYDETLIKGYNEAMKNYKQ